MRRLFSLLLCLVLVANPSLADSVKRISITFDDAPRGPGRLMDVDARTSMLINSLDAAGVQGAIFFATTRNLEQRGEEGSRRLRRYAEAGHVIANHSHAHGSANSLTAEAFVADVALAKEKLAGFPNNVALFRFPFLNEGDTPEKRDAIRAGLESLGLGQGYVTIDNYDWYLQALLDEALASDWPLDLNAWRDVYVDVLLSAVEHYDAMAMDTLGRSPAHSLLLHENDLAALFIDDLVLALRERGWEIIPGVEAYDDPIAESLPDTMWLSQGRVAALAAVAGRDPVSLRHPLESESALRALLVSRDLIGLREGAYLSEEPPGIVPKPFAPGIISLDDQFEYGTHLTPDGRVLFFGVAIEGRGEIRMSRYRDGEWTAPETILSHPEYSFADPFLSRDQTRLYFITRLPGANGKGGEDYNIAYVRRQRDGWSEPVFLDAPVNSAANEYFVSFTDDGRLVFASNRHEPDGSDFDIYMAERVDGGFAEPQRLPGRANTRAYEADPFVAADGSYVLFSSTRRWGEGGRDIFASFRLHDGSWSRAVSLGKRINTPAQEFCPFVSRDGRFLFYTSNEDIYWVDAAVIDLAKESLADAEVFFDGP